MSSWLQFEILSNTVEQCLWVAGIIMVVLLLNRYLSRFINFVLHRTLLRFTSKSYLQEFQSMVLRPMQWLIAVVIVRVALNGMNYPQAWEVKILKGDLHSILDRVFEAVILFAFIRVLIRIVDFISLYLLRRAARTADKTDDMLVPFFRDIARGVLYIAFLLALLGGIIGLNITSLLAGLGIGGLAIAFAAQESIKDLFGSLTIFFDKPFSLGDTIKVNEVEGVVEHVGFRSTRIRTADHSVVTVPNKKMTDTNVDNLTVRKFRRVKMVIGLSYNTRSDTLKKIIEEIKKYLTAHSQFNQRATTVILDEFTESSLRIVIVYFIPFTETDEHLQLKEEVNFKIMEIVQGNGASFATPVREIRVESWDAAKGQMRAPQQP